MDGMLAHNLNPAANEGVVERAYTTPAEAETIRLIDEAHSTFDVTLLTKPQQAAREIMAVMPVLAPHEDLLLELSNRFGREVMQHPAAQADQLFTVHMETVKASAIRDLPHAADSITRVVALPSSGNAGVSGNLSPQDIEAMHEDMAAGDETLLLFTAYPSYVEEKIETEQETVLDADTIQRLISIQQRMELRAKNEAQAAAMQGSPDAIAALTGILVQLGKMGASLQNHDKAAKNLNGAGQKQELGKVSQSIRSESRAMADSIQKASMNAGLPPKLREALRTGLKEMREIGVLAEKNPPKVTATPRAKSEAAVPKNAATNNAQPAKNAPRSSNVVSIKSAFAAATKETQKPTPARVTMMVSRAAEQSVRSTAINTQTRDNSQKPPESKPNANNDNSVRTVTAVTNKVETPNVRDSGPANPQAGIAANTIASTAQQPRTPAATAAAVTASLAIGGFSTQPAASAASVSTNSSSSISASVSSSSPVSLQSSAPAASTPSTPSVSTSSVSTSAPGTPATSTPTASQAAPASPAAPQAATPQATAPQAVQPSAPPPTQPTAATPHVQAAAPQTPAVTATAPTVQAVAPVAPTAPVAEAPAAAAPTAVAPTAVAPTVAVTSAPAGAAPATPSAPIAAAPTAAQPATAPVAEAVTAPAAPAAPPVVPTTNVTSSEKAEIDTANRGPNGAGDPAGDKIERGGQVTTSEPEKAKEARPDEKGKEPVAPPTTPENPVTNPEDKPDIKDQFKKTASECEECDGKKGCCKIGNAEAAIKEDLAETKVDTVSEAKAVEGGSRSGRRRSNSSAPKPEPN